MPSGWLKILFFYCLPHQCSHYVFSIKIIYLSHSYGKCEGTTIIISSEQKRARGFWRWNGGGTAKLYIEVTFMPDER